MKHRTTTLLLLCMLQACWMEASWLSNFTNSVSSMATSAVNLVQRSLSHKTEIRGVVVPTAGICAVAGLVIAGIVWKLVGTYNQYHADRCGKACDRFNFFPGCDFALQPKDLSCSSNRHPLILPKKITVFPNGLIVLPSLQQIEKSKYIDWEKQIEAWKTDVGATECKLTADEKIAGMNWPGVQKHGEATYCGYHALSYAHRMLCAYQAAIGPDEDGAGRFKENLVTEYVCRASQLECYLQDLKAWLPKMKEIREFRGADFDYGTWLTSADFEGDEGASGLVAEVENFEKIWVIDSFDDLFFAHGPRVSSAIPLLRAAAESENFAHAFIVPATALEHSHADVADLHTVQTHWVAFVVTKIAGDLKIFFADSLYDRFVNRGIRNRMYNKFKELFSMSPTDVDDFERAMYEHVAQGQIKELKAKMVKVFPNETMQYRFVGYLQTPDMALYEFDKIDDELLVFNQDKRPSETKTVEDNYEITEFADSMKDQLKTILRSRNGVVKRFWDCLDASEDLRSMLATSGYTAVAGMCGISYIAKPYLITVWQNVLDRGKYFFVACDVPRDEDCAGYCLKYRDISYVLNGIDRELPASTTTLLLECYQEILEGKITINDEEKTFGDESFVWPVSLINASLYLLFQTTTVLAINIGNEQITGHCDEVMKQACNLLHLLERKVAYLSDKLSCMPQAELLIDAADNLSRLAEGPYEVDRPLVGDIAHASTLSCNLQDFLKRYILLEETKKSL